MADALDKYAPTAAATPQAAVDKYAPAAPSVPGSTQESADKYAPTPAPTMLAESTSPKPQGIMEGINQFVNDTATAPFHLMGGLVHDAESYGKYAAKNGSMLASLAYQTEYIQKLGLPFDPQTQKDIASMVGTLHSLSPEIKRTLSEDDQKSLDRGLVNIASMTAPVGKATAFATQAIPNLLVRRIAAAEIHSIASFVGWNLGQHMVEGEPYTAQNAAQDVAIGAITPPALKGVGFTAGQAAKLSGKAILPMLNKLQLMVGAKNYLSNFVDGALYNGESVLRKAGLNSVADGLLLSRGAMYTRAAIWNGRVEKAVLGLSADDREIVGEMLHSPIEPSELAKRTTTDPARLEQARKEISDVLLRVGSLLEQLGVPVRDPADGSFHRFVRRADFGLPHIYVDTEQFINTGPMRDKALTVLKDEHHMSQADAELFLEKFHARNMGEVDEVETSRGRIVGSVAMMGRRYNLPGYVIDPAAVLPSYLMSAARRIENTMRFGDPLRQIKPLVLAPDASQKALAQTVTDNGGVFALDDNLSPYARRGYAVRLTGESVPAVNLTPQMIEDAAMQAPDFQKKFPGMRFAVKTTITNGQAHVDIVGIVPDRKAAQALGEVAQQPSITRLGRTGQIMRSHPTTQKAAANLTTQDAQDMLSKWVTTKIGAPFAKDPALPSVINARTMYPRAFQPLENVSDPGLRRIAESITARQLGFGVEEDGVDAGTQKLISKLLAFQAITKLGLSQLTQLSQFLSPIGATGYKGAVSDLFKLMARDPLVHDAIAQTGVTMGEAIREAESLLGGEGGLAKEILLKTGFTSADIGARQYDVLRAWTFLAHQADEMFAMNVRRNKIAVNSLEYKYINSKLGAIEKKMVQLGLDPVEIVKRGRVLPEEFMRVGQKLSTDMNFWGDALSLPAYWKSPWGRVLTQFKSFSYQQAKYIKDYVVKPALVDGDIGPLVRLFPAAVLGGEVVADLKSLIRMHPRKDSGVKRILDDMAYMGTFGLVSDAIQGGSDPEKLLSFLAGPTASDVAAIGSGIITGNVRQLTKKGIAYGGSVVLPPIGTIVAPGVANLVVPSKTQGKQQ